MKKCKTCLVEKPFSEFYTNGKTPKGRTKYKPDCRVCHESERFMFKEHKLAVIKDRYGTSCTICGYDKCYAALDFHHVDPKAKEFHPSHLVHNMSPIETLIRELDKCILVCANCHREIHDRD